MKVFTYFNFAYLLSSYYMTPFATILHFLSKTLPKLPGLFKGYIFSKSILYFNSLSVYYFSFYLLVNFRSTIDFISLLSMGSVRLNSSNYMIFSNIVNTYETVVYLFVFWAWDIKDLTVYLFMTVESSLYS